MALTRALRRALRRSQEVLWLDRVRPDALDPANVTSVRADQVRLAGG